ncbi:hypothetical protein JMM63_20695 [Rhodovulum sulfidophilum]|uniref:hypothetical protein n=1 Tax=Rhodovulum sulfidophilum TaxID=35806 RepID=UPI001921BC24|nr:hypothetical protein [Rhodovulum sulfidophilum]MBL3597938.1 hypothetical protein [Rhodovulum sulfidophilum]
MKHETINSIVGVLGLVIASVTAVRQFWPEAERLQVVVEGRAETGRPIDVSGFGMLRVSDEKPSPLFGPVSWKIRLFNNTDRNLSVVGYQIFQLTEDGAKVSSNALRDRLSQFDLSLAEQPFPFSIDGFDATAVVISLMVPFEEESEGAEECAEPQVSIQQFERCFFKQGRDLFGNQVEKIHYDAAAAGMFSVKWNETTYSPKFLVEFETASGAVFSAPISYYPF